MKRISILALLLLFAQGCAHSPRLAPAPARTPSSVGTIAPLDLTLAQNELDSFREISKVFAGEEISAAQFRVLIRGIGSDSKFGDVLMAYRSDTYRALGVEDPFAWMSENGEILGPIGEYIDPQEEGEPIWQSTNRALRNGEVLTAKQKQFVLRMKSSIDALPQFRGIVFRGVNIQKSDLARYQVGKSVTEKSFLSTSVDPAIADKFANQEREGDRVAVLFVIKARAGGPISAFHPGNNHEVEVLLQPNSRFRVVRSIGSTGDKFLYLLMEQLGQ